MGKLIEGKWHSDDAVITDTKGRFVRKATTFRGGLSDDGSSAFPVEAGRYHLLVAAACPWAHRVVLTRALRGLTDAVSMSVAHPLMLEHGWDFSQGERPTPDVDYLYQVYLRADAAYSGRATVPVLWDTKAATIVNNESREIMRM
ncbi:MAG: glutathione S-transferase family protein, partial [Nannocystaceae bacterium]|nr:glutathione S-transferase family protein [Nannocystaceae bacterium]